MKSARQRVKSRSARTVNENLMDVSLANVKSFLAYFDQPNDQSSPQLVAKYWAYWLARSLSAFSPAMVSQLKAATALWFMRLHGGISAKGRLGFGSDNERH